MPQMATFWPSLLTSSAEMGNGPSSCQDAASPFVTRWVLPVRNGARTMGRPEMLIDSVDACAVPAMFCVPYAGGHRFASPPSRENSVGDTRSTVAGMPVLSDPIEDAANRNARTWSAVLVAVRTSDDPAP